MEPVSPNMDTLLDLWQYKARPFTWSWIRDWCVSWWLSGREDDGDEYEDTQSDMGYGTPVSVETPLQSSVSRCTSLNVIRDPYASGMSGNFPNRSHHLIHHGFESRSLPTNNRLASRSLSNDSVYTVLIQIPDGIPCESNGLGSVGQGQASVKLIENDGPLPIRGSAGIPPRLTARVDSSTSMECAGFPSSPGTGLARRASQTTDVRIPLNAKIVPKQLAGNPKSHLASAAQPKHPPKKKKKTQEKKADKKAAKTLSAILLSFIITWTPYNILVLIKPLTTSGGSSPIPQVLWDFFYYLCYINSTINPVCYALCNASFRRTYVRILTCKWHSRNRTAINRGFYN